MIIRRWLLIESDRQRSTWAVRSRHLWYWTARRARLRRMAAHGCQEYDPSTRYGWTVGPAVRLPRSHVT